MLVAEFLDLPKNTPLCESHARQLMGALPSERSDVEVANQYEWRISIPTTLPGGPLAVVTYDVRKREAVIDIPLKGSGNEMAYARRSAVLTRDAFVALLRVVAGWPL